jgi:hypothetical protein
MIETLFRNQAPQVFRFMPLLHSLVSLPHLPPFWSCTPRDAGGSGAFIQGLVALLATLQTLYHPKPMSCLGVQDHHD